MEPNAPGHPTPEQVAGMTELADKIINEVGRGKLEVDLCNACMLVIQLVCDHSESAFLGEVTADPLHQLAQHLLKKSVTRQVAQARIEMLPPGSLEQQSEDEEPSPSPAARRKPYLN